jgi:SAM-dependent methyltransferase
MILSITKYKKNGIKRNNMEKEDASVFKTGSSLVLKECQVCKNNILEPILFLGYMPPVNKVNKIGEKPKEQPSYPAQVLHCSECNLVQLGLIVDAEVLFPYEYPYTSSTTKILRENFFELYQESKEIINLKETDLIIDIGSNDGNLLSNFKKNHKVLGITPEEIGKLAIEKGIPTIIDYFTKDVADKVKLEYGKAKVITATNVFAHIEKINEVVENLIEILDEGGVFISESHYLLKLIETIQYDTVYHEHLRYYSLHSLKYLLEKHGLEVFHAKEIPTHGGSIRVYASRKGKFQIKETVEELLNEEKKKIIGKENLLKFKDRVVKSKLQLHSLLKGIKEQGAKIYGISAPSRASTLINYTGIDDGILEAVMEIKGSYKIGNYIPGTIVPILEESKLYEKQPEYALLLSWHIADELIPKIREKGFRGKFIVPLPEPKIV